MAAEAASRKPRQDLPFDHILFVGARDVDDVSSAGWRTIASMVKAPTGRSGQVSFLFERTADGLKVSPYHIDEDLLH